MSTYIRKAVPTDFEAIFCLMQDFALFQKTPEKLFTTPQQLLADQDLFQCLVAITDERVIGFASYFFSYHSWSGKALYLDDLYVTHHCRGKGTGTNLLQTVIELARENNCRQVRWLVSTWNEAAITFYQKTGAVIDPIDVTCILNLDNSFK